MLSTRYSSNIKILIKYIFLGLIIFQVTNLVSAHTSGFSVEKEVADFLVDVGYSNEILIENTQIRFDFDILDKENKQQVKFNEVWVRIENADRLLFAGGLGKAKFGATGMSYSFPEAGDYIISTRFSDASSTLAETEFTFDVMEESKTIIEKIWFWPVVYTNIVWFLITVTILSLVFLLKVISPSDKVLNTKSVKTQIFWKKTLGVLMFLFLMAVGYFLASLVTNLIG